AVREMIPVAMTTPKYAGDSAARSARRRVSPHRPRRLRAFITGAAPVRRGNGGAQAADGPKPKTAAVETEAALAPGLRLLGTCLLLTHAGIRGKRIARSEMPPGPGS